MGEELTLELARPEKSGFIVSSIDGLGPVKSTINTTKLARSHGARYNSSYSDVRSIVINLTYYDDGSVTMESLRHKSYKYFPENEEIKLTIVTDTRAVYTKCYVEHNEPDIFSNSEGATITILCPDPYFYDIGYKSIAFNMVEPAFEFPFPSDNTEEPSIEFGNIRDVFTRGIKYDGDCNVGVNITLYIYGNTINPTIYNHMTQDRMCIDTSKLSKLLGTEGVGLIANDIIEINTNGMSKSAKLLRNGEYINILNCLDKHTQWITLTRGNNSISCYADNNTSSRISLYITYNTAYGGI